MLIYKIKVSTNKKSIIIKKKIITDFCKEIFEINFTLLIFIKRLTETDSPVTISLYAGVGMIPATFIAAYPYLIMPNLYQFLIILYWVNEISVPI